MYDSVCVWRVGAARDWGSAPRIRIDEIDPILPNGASLQPTIKTKLSLWTRPTRRLHHHHHYPTHPEKGSFDSSGKIGLWSAMEFFWPFHNTRGRNKACKPRRYASLKLSLTHSEGQVAEMLDHLKIVVSQVTIFKSPILIGWLQSLGFQKWWREALLFLKSGDHQWQHSRASPVEPLLGR